MYKYLIILISILCMGCQRETESSTRHDVVLGLSLLVEDAHLVSRSPGAELIQDVNIFIYNDQGLVYEDFYTRNSFFSIRLQPDEYRCYVVANYGQKIGQCTEQQMELMTVNFSSGELGKLYTAKRILDLRNQSGNSGIVMTIPVKRAGARIDYIITVAPHLSGLTIEGVRICNVPALTGLFKECRDNYYRSTRWDDVAITDNRTVEGTIWMPENLRGVNNQILNQKDKSQKNAPEDATYIHITASWQGNPVYYRVYLGENNTDDFNVRRNTNHLLQITILTPDELDTRMTQSVVSITNTSGWSYLIAGEHNVYEICAQSLNEDLNYTARLEVTSGSTESFTFNGRRLNPVEQIPLGNQPSTITLGHVSNNPGANDNQLEFVITVSDKYGMIKKESFLICYGFAIDVLLHMTGSQSNLGTYTIDTPREKRRTYPAPNLVCDRHIYLPDARVLLMARPHGNNTFEGWYYNANYDQLFDSHQSVILVNSSAFLTLSPKFTKDPYD